VNPKLLELGTKSGSRRVFRRAGIALPEGLEDLHSEQEVVQATSDLWEAKPELKRVVIKHDEGFSGEGNATLSLGGINHVAPGKASRANREEAIYDHLDQTRFASHAERRDTFFAQMQSMGGIVEEFVEGLNKRSPSGQMRINPRGELEAMSTHDQLVGGPDGQTYMGCRFPADPSYRLDIQADTMRVGQVLVEEGVIGRAAVDFVAVEREAEPGSWDHFAIEINLRMSGTTHPLMIMRMLNEGAYDPTSGLYLTGRQEPRFYVASDSVYKPHYRGLVVDDVLDIAAVHELHYRPWTDTGVVFHLTGALSEHGKIGITAIGESPEMAQNWFERAAGALDLETQPPSPAITQATRG
jgi:hypothetical protein